MNITSLSFQMKGINLSFLRTCIAVAEERPRISLTQTFSALFSSLGLSQNAVSTSFGSRVNIAISMQVWECLHKNINIKLIRCYNDVCLYAIFYPWTILLLVKSESFLFPGSVSPGSVKCLH